MSTEKKDPIIIISGPTATGKTSTSLMLAHEIRKTLKKDCVIFNFDSLLFYKELSIGTAKPSLEERESIPHEMVDIVSIKEPLNASEYVHRVTPIIYDALKDNKIPLLVGGSGFYLRALIKGMYESPTTPPEIQKKINDVYKDKGIQVLREELRQIDPESYEALHENDHYRIIRALEHFHTTHSKISDQKELLEKSEPYNFAINIHPSWNLYHLYLDIPKNEHFDIIQKRADKMINDGLVQEVESLLERGFSKDLKPLHSIGYQEVLDFLEGRMPDTAALKDRISISTRQLAKAQRTWFKKIPDKVCRNPLLDNLQMTKDILLFLNQNS